MPDALSQLPSNAGAVKRATDPDPDKDEGFLDMAYHVALIEVSDGFKTRLREGLKQTDAAISRHHDKHPVGSENRDNYLEEQ